MSRARTFDLICNGCEIDQVIQGYSDWDIAKRREISRSYPRHVESHISKRTDNVQEEREFWTRHDTGQNMMTTMSRRLIWRNKMLAGCSMALRRTTLVVHVLRSQSEPEPRHSRLASREDCNAVNLGHTFTDHSSRPIRSQ